MPNLNDVLQSNPEGLTDSDLAVLADYAAQQNKATPHGDWKRAYALIREGADLLLRRRARSREVPKTEPEEKPELSEPICGACGEVSSKHIQSAVGSGHKFVTFEQNP